MKKLLALLTCLLWASIATAQSPSEPSASHLWERALFGDKPGITMVSLEGFNPTSTTTTEPLWPESNTYTPLSAAMSAPYCASSDANDTSAGTGARTVRVSGIDTSYALFTETVTMNGQTSVVLAKANILMFTGIEVLTTGSGNLNAGIIQCGTGANTAGDPAVTHAYLGISSLTVANAPGNKSRMFFYGVPAGYTLLCRDFYIGVPSATAAHNATLFLDTYTNGGILKRYYVGSGEAGGPFLGAKYFNFPEKTLIIGQVQNVGGTIAYASANCLLVSNTWESSSQGIF